MVPANFHFPERTRSAPQRRSDAGQREDPDCAVIRFPLERVRRSVALVR